MNNPGRLTIALEGHTPIPQGSKVANRHGGGVRDANATKLKPWRKAITTAAQDAARYHDTYTGPVRIWIRFAFNRPTSHYRAGKFSDLLKDTAPLFPTNKNDLDKLQRAILDALTYADVWNDDGQAVDIRARKFYAGEHELAPQRPGVHIIIEPLEGGPH